MLNQVPEMVHRESLAGLNRMNTMQRKDVSRRVMKNEDITRAKAF